MISEFGYGPLFRCCQFLWYLRIHFVKKCWNSQCVHVQNFCCVGDSVAISAVIYSYSLVWWWCIETVLGTFNIYSIYASVTIWQLTRTSRSINHQLIAGQHHFSFGPSKKVGQNLWYILHKRRLLTNYSYLLKIAKNMIFSLNTYMRGFEFEGCLSTFSCSGTVYHKT